MIEVDLNDLVEFILVDATHTVLPARLEAKHPMHLHGNRFAVVAMHEVHSFLRAYSLSKPSF